MTTVAVLAVLSVTLALAEDFKTDAPKEANRSNTSAPTPSAGSAKHPNSDDIVRVGIEYSSPEECVDDTRHAARVEGFSRKDEKEALAKIPAGGRCEVELYADSIEAADPKRLTYVIFNSIGKELQRRKGKLIGTPKSSVSYWWKGGDQIDLPAIHDSLRLRIYDELRGETLGEYVFRPKQDPDRVCCDKFTPPPGERGVLSKILK